ncbi:MAG TPA: DUF4350 domain-containing protein [Polyangiaceae bacterium]|nr:DUF4350 domain-containing protein [Polyangiaceae bacterium]
MRSRNYSFDQKNGVTRHGLSLFQEAFPARFGRKTGRRPFRRGCPAALLGLCLGALVLALTRDASAAFEPKDTTWQGGSELYGIARDRLGKARVRIAAELPWDEVQPTDAILVVHPERELDYREVAAFLAAGGRLAVLDDYGKGDALLRRFRIHRVRGPLVPRETLRDNPNLAIASPPEAPDVRPHPVVLGVDRVMTNHPTALETDPGLKLTTVLEIPGTSEPSAALALIGVIGDAKRCGLAGESDDLSLAPSPTTGKCGRLFAMGDPSALMNSMLRYPGNRALAGRLVEYLVGDDTWGHRGGTLYVVTNDFSERGSFGNRSGFAAAIDDRLEALGRLVAETRRDGLPEPFALLLAATLAVGIAVWAGSAAMRRYRRAVPRYARPTPLVAQGGLAGRAAVLSAETTHRALAVLEMKAALEEAARERLGLPETAGTADIIQEIDGRNALGRRSSESLSALFREMELAEARVTRTEPIRIPPDKVRRMHEEMASILSELDERLGRRP